MHKKLLKKNFLVGGIAYNNFNNLNQCEMTRFINLSKN